MIPRCYTCQDWRTRPHSHRAGEITRRRDSDALYVFQWNAAGEVQTIVRIGGSTYPGKFHVSLHVMDRTGRCKGNGTLMSPDQIESLLAARGVAA